MARERRDGDRVRRAGARAEPERLDEIADPDVACAAGHVSDLEGGRSRPSGRTTRSRVSATAMSRPPQTRICAPCRMRSRKFCASAATRSCT